MAPTDQPAAYGLARPVGPQWQPCALMVEKCLKPDNAADLKISTKEISDEDGMLLDHMERPVLDLIAKRNHASHPDALPLRGGDLVPDPLAGDLAFKLGEGQEHVQGQSSHAGRGVERLGDRDERHLMSVEEFDQLGEVGERAGQPVDLVDDDDIDPASANVIKELLERWPLHRAARVATVVVVGADQLPALVGLALDVGFRCLPLIIERVELLLQAMLSRDAGVDGAAQRRFASLRSHGEAACRLGRRAKAAPSALLGVGAASDEAASQPPAPGGPIPDRWDLAVRKPKKRWPFQLVPVIALATCDRLPYVSPFQATPWSRLITRS